MDLFSLLNRIEYEVLQGNIINKPVSNLVYDSRKVKQGDVFVCISGTVKDAHEYLPDVIAKGAIAIIVEKDVEAPEEVTVIKVNNTRYALACMSAAYFGYPAEKLTTIGITGTKGKTTSTYMVRSVLEKAGFKTGLIGTIEIIIGDESVQAVNTTPESYILQENLSKMVEAGCKCVVMEVSSQGLMLHRVSGFVFDYAVFTNLSRDHIGGNEHKDFEDYMRCKSLLFKQSKHGIVNADDPYVKKIIAGSSCTIETFGINQEADIKANNIRLLKKFGLLGSSYHVTGLADIDIEISNPGKFNVYNSLTAIALCLHFTKDIELIRNILSDIQVRGRTEIAARSDKFTFIIDYAHNAVSLESILRSIKEYNPKRIVSIFGCGGSRDRNRRFEMGEVSSNLSDFSIITTDNPRDEEPEEIIKDILIGIRKGSGKYIAITDRREAIHYAIDHAQQGDVIVLAGKGHETYQEIRGIKYPMDDRDLIADALITNNG